MRLSSCGRGICSHGVECMSECERPVREELEDDPGDVFDVDPDECDREADRYFEARERVLEKNREY